MIAVRMRVAEVVVLTVVAALAQSPGLHIHQASHANAHAAHEHDHRVARHIHSTATTTTGLTNAFSASSDQDPLELDLAWVASRHLVVDQSVAPAATLSLPTAPQKQLLPLLPTVPCAHDPPGESPRIPRAPPTFILA